MKDKGITLVALVVTIIILLILVGATMGSILGNEGIFFRTKQAIDLYKNAQEQEQLNIDELYTKLADLSDKSEITESEIREMIEEIVDAKLAENNNSSLEGSTLKLLTGLIKDSPSAGDMSTFTRNETDITNSYLRYDSTSHKYEVLKSGWYMFV